MRDNISLIAAAVGGFMLTIAVAGIVKAAPVNSLKAQPSFTSNSVTNVRLAPVDP